MPLPLYDYKCPDHGVFYELFSLEDKSEVCSCPVCGQASPRIIMIPPEVMSMSPKNRKACETNERSSFEPLVSTPDSRDKKNGRACSCEQKARKPSKLLFLPDGSKIFPANRPWMISH